MSPVRAHHFQALHILGLSSWDLYFVILKHGICALPCWGLLQGWEPSAECLCVRSLNLNFHTTAGSHNLGPGISDCAAFSMCNTEISKYTTSAKLLLNPTCLSHVMPWLGKPEFPEITKPKSQIAHGPVGNTCKNPRNLTIGLLLWGSTFGAKVQAPDARHSAMHQAFVWQRTNCKTYIPGCAIGEIYLRRNWILGFVLCPLAVRHGQVNCRSYEFGPGICASSRLVKEFPGITEPKSQISHERIRCLKLRCSREGWDLGCGSWDL